MITKDGLIAWAANNQMKIY